MFISPKADGYLFSSGNLEYLLQEMRGKIPTEVERLDANRLLNTAPEDLIAYLMQLATVEPITLRRDEWYVDTEEVQIDVRGDSSRYIRDMSRPALVPGERVTVHVPFDGHELFFFSQSNHWSTNPPRGKVAGGELILEFQYPSDSPREVRPEVDRVLANIEQYLEWQGSQINAHNASLHQLAAQVVNDRRARLLAKSQRTAALGIPVRQRSDAPKTFAVPTARRKAAPTLPPATSKPFEPEPAWAMDQYEHALKVLQDMALVMERSPAAFKSMDEEALRQHFLVQLNAQFEGKASGETFNMSGKTDILLREGERNVFIAECKFWKGPKAFGEAIDQLLGYTTWRDSKTAILVFNKGVDTSKVLGGIEATAQAHANFKRKEAYRHESGFRYVFHQPGDSNRELIITVLVFHVPS